MHTWWMTPTVTVKLTDRREFTARVLGKDAQTDVAVLKIAADGLPTVRLGNPDELKVGQWVLAIGSPFGFDNTVTAGIVSAKGRSLPDETYVPFIQTDVAVNPGNSGGPLFNLNGEVVGINSQIFSRTGGYEGLSFAIPIDVAMRVQKELVANGRVSRGWLGVGIQGMSKELARSFGLDQPRGALVSQVQPDSPAAQAGLKPGDVILEFDGRAVNDSADLPPLVGSSAVGSSARLKVLRDGRETTDGADSPTGRQRRMRPHHARRQQGWGSLGVAVADLTPGDAQLGVQSGVVVTAVAEGPAAEAGIRRGDVAAPRQVRHKDSRQLRSWCLAPDQPLPILVRRGDSTLFLALEPLSRNG
jgi:serine protease Do